MNIGRPIKEYEIIPDDIPAMEPIMVPDEELVPVGQ